MVPINRPVGTGIAFAIAIGVFYALCTPAWLSASGALLSFVGYLFHGIDLSSLVQPRPFAWSGFLVALLVLSGWSLVAGTIFAWPLRRPTHRPPLDFWSIR